MVSPPKRPRTLAAPRSAALSEDHCCISNCTWLKLSTTGHTGNNELNDDDCEERKRNRHYRSEAGTESNSDQDESCDDACKHEKAKSSFALLPAHFHRRVHFIVVSPDVDANTSIQFRSRNLKMTVIRLSIGTRRIVGRKLMS